MSLTQTPPGPPPGPVMLQILGGFQVSQAAFVIAELGVATILEQEGSKTVTELADRTGAKPEPLGRLIRSLAPLGIFSTDGEQVRITPLGATLSEKHPRSLAAVAQLYQQTHYHEFSELGHTVRTGQPAAEHYHGEPFFDWLSRDADREALFSRAMGNVTGGLRAGMFDGYQLPAGRTVADIGGSNGSVLVELFNRDEATDRRGIVFDRPPAKPSAEDNLATAGLADRVVFVGGDFFDAVPTADIYIIGYILHDWDDESCRRILASIAAAAAPGARLIVIEGLIPPGDEPHMMKAVDLVMLTMITGKERTEQEYRDLLDGAGFDVDRVIATPSPFAILEATLR